MRASLAYNRSKQRRGLGKGREGGGKRGDVVGDSWEISLERRKITLDGIGERPDGASDDDNTVEELHGREVEEIVEKDATDLKLDGQPEGPACCTAAFIAERP